LVGIYSVQSLTENGETCEAEGPSVLAGDRDHMVILARSFVGGRYIQVEGCADPAACRQLVRNIQEDRGIPVTFSFRFHAGKGDHLEGPLVTTGYSGPVCTEGEVAKFTLVEPTE